MRRKAWITGLIIGALHLITMTGTVLANTTTVTNETVTITASNEDSEPVEITIPSSVTGEKFDGSGTVIDLTYSGEKLFYTIETIDGEIYYLVIDTKKESNNVYYLKEVNQTDILLNSQEQPVSNEEPTVPINNTTAEEPSNSQSSGINFFPLAIMGIAGVGAGLYFYKMEKGGKKPKSSKSKEDDDMDEFEDFDSIMSEEAMSEWANIDNTNDK